MKREHTFRISHESTIDGQTYEGVFTCKKRSIQDDSKLGVRIVQLNGGMHYDDSKPGYGVDENTYSLNFMIATLEIGLTQKPDWFDVNTLVDQELLHLVFKEVASFEASFRRKPKQQPDDSTVSTAGSKAQESQTDGSRETRKVVPREIQASLEP